MPQTPAAPPALIKMEGLYLRSVFAAFRFAAFNL
jgi:hypothetical protein